MPGMTRRALLGATVATAAVTVLGCGRLSSGVVPDGTPLQLAADGLLLPAARALVSAYRAQGGQAQAVVAAGGMSALINTMLGGSNSVGVDVLLLTPKVRRIWDATSLMLDLGPVLARTGLDSGLYPSVLTAGQFQGRQLIMPVFRDPLVLFYNADALARTGNNPPAAGWTLSALMDLCVSLQRAGMRPLLQSASVHGAELLTAFVIGYGGEVMIPSPAGGTGFVPTFTSPVALQGLAALVDLHRYIATPTPASAVQAFARGDAALLFGHHRDVPALQAAIGTLFAWNVAPVPRFPSRRAQPVQADGLAAVTTVAARRTGSLALTLYGATAAGQQALARTGLGVPARASLASSSLWRSAAPNLDNDVFVSGSSADVVVPQPLFFIWLPDLALALQAAVRGVAVAEAFGAAATAAEFTLANWPAV